MIFIFIIGFTMAFIAPFVFRISGKYTGVILSILPVGIFAFFCIYVKDIIQGKNFIFKYTWAPDLSGDILFYLDGLSLFFVFLISGFGALIILYGSSYMKNHSLSGRFFMYLIFFMISMLGLVLAGDLISFYLFWELTSISSYLLISFKNESSSSRSSALQALLITVAGGLAMLAGFIVLGNVAGTYSIPEVLSQQDGIVNSPYYTSILILILIGAFTKSAQFPFHFWLPAAMTAPTPVSAYLHSATMVKVGIFLVARFYPALGGTQLWETLLMSIGGLTMVVGALLALKYTDLKKVLAYTTISALGMIFLILGIGTDQAIQAALVYILVHALYKGSLFLVVGNLDQQTGSRDMKELSGLRNRMPYTGIAAILACLSMVGVIPSIGFVGKELVYEAALTSPLYSLVMLPAIIFSNSIYVVIAIIIGYNLFFGIPKSPKSYIREVRFPMLVGPLILAALGLLFGLFPQFITQPLLKISATDLLKEGEVVSLALWHGFNLTFILSLGTLVLGLVFYGVIYKIRTKIAGVSAIEKYGAEVIYKYGFNGILKAAYGITRFFQNGYLRYYITTILLTFMGMVVYVLITRNLALNYHYLSEGLHDFWIYELLVCVFIAASIIKILYSNSRLTAVVAMGTGGYGLALIFIFFSAPDIAMTQILIETMTLVLFVLVLHQLPRFETFHKKLSRFIYILISLLFGGIMTYILLLITAFPLASELKDFYGAYSVSEGHGRNIVNVILVDFRALDTLGESTVLAIAAIGIFALLKLKPENNL